MQATVCDRCPRKVPEESKPGKLEVKYTASDGQVFGTEGVWDICPACDSPVRNIIDKLLLVKIPKEETEEEAPKSEAKPEPEPLIKEGKSAKPHPHFEGGQ